MLFSVIFDAVVASLLAFVFMNLILLLFGNLLLGKEKKFLTLEEIRKEIRNIISEETE